MIVALFILAFFACFGVYVYTDLTEHMAEQQLIDEIESLPAPHHAGERGDRPDSLRSNALRGLTAPAGATVFDWDVDGYGDAA